MGSCMRHQRSGDEQSVQSVLPSIESEKPSPVQARVLEGTLAELNSRFGKGSIMRLGSEPEQRV